MRNQLNPYLAILIVTIVASAATYGLILECQKIEAFDSLPSAMRHQVLDDATSLMDTSDWKTYTNEEYGFKVKYPAKWVYREINSETIYFENSEEKYYMEGSEISPIIIGTRDSQRYISSLEFTQKQNIYNGTVTTLAIDGKEVARLEDYLGVRTNILHAHKIYSVERNTGDMRVHDIYQTMLSTFKFTR